MEPNYTIYMWYILAILASAYAGIYAKKYIKENPNLKESVKINVNN